MKLLFEKKIYFALQKRSPSEQGKVHRERERKNKGPIKAKLG